MTHRFRIGALLSVVLLAACGFPKTGPAPSALSPAQLTAATARSPGVTEQSLATGHDLFVAKCNGCHGYPDLGTVAQDKWPSIVKRMSAKADLSAPQGDDVLHFVLAASAGTPSAP